MICIKCRKAHLVEGLADLDVEVKGETVVVPNTEAMKCPNCGFQTIRGSAVAEHMRRAADVYRRKHNLLTSGEIRERRERLGMTQEQFAAYVSVGVASIKRWELGQVQEAGPDMLLRLRTSRHEALAALEVLSDLLKNNHVTHGPAEGNTLLPLVPPSNARVEPTTWTDQDNKWAASVKVPANLRPRDKAAA